MKQHQLRNTILLIAVLVTTSLFAQDWVKMMKDPSVNFYDVQKAFNKYYLVAKAEKDNEDKTSKKSEAVNEDEENEVPGYTQYKRWECFMKPRVSATGERFDPSIVWQEMTKYRQKYPNVNAGNWTLIGPTNTSALAGAGRLNFVRVHPTNPQILFTGSPAGGLWVSTNGGSSWSTNTDWTAQVIGYTDVAFDPTNANIMYACTGDGDAGDTYTVGLLKSTDGGVTWNPTGLSFGMGAYRQLSRVIVDPSNGNNIYVATTAGIYKSTDAGVTFTNVLQGSFQSLEFKPGTSSTLYCAGTSFYVSTNSGSNWTQVTSGLNQPANLSRMAIAVSAASPNTVYVNSGLAAPNYGEDGFYVSTNGGAGMTFSKHGTPSGFGNQEWYDLAIAASPTTANEVMIGGQTVFYKTTNANNAAPTWSTIASNTHVDYHGVTYASGTNVYLTSDGGIYGSTNDGSNWTNLNNNMTIAEMYGFGQSVSNANLLIQGWQDNGTNIYSGTWSSTLGGDGMMAFISHSNDQHMWGEQYEGSLNKSTTGGTSWSSATSGITEGPGTAAAAWNTQWMEDPSTADKLYAGFQNVWVSTNGGSSWTKPGNVAGTATTTIDAMAVSPANTQVLWASKGGSLYKSTNGGTTWAVVSSAPVGTISGITCSNTDANRAWIVYSGFTNNTKVYQTTNQGTSWTDLVSQSLPNIPINCIAYVNSSNDALYIGTDVGVFYKDATLNVWQPFSSGLPNVTVTQLEIFYSGNVIRASTYGRGIWESGFYTPGAYAPTANFAANENISCPGAAIQFTDYSAGQPTSWSWTFPGGSPSSSTQQNPLVYYNTAGTYSVSLTATNTNGSNSITQNSFITIAASPYAAPTAVSNINFCAPSTVPLSATPSHNPGTIRWWTQAGGGSPVATGNTYTTPTLTATTTYYADEAFPAGLQDITGEGTDGIGAGAFFTANDIRGLYFDVTSPVIINSFDVYAETAGNRTIQILDSQGNTYYDTTLYIAATNSVTASTVNVNIPVYTGTNYFIKFLGLVDCYRNTAGAIYPINSTDVNITGSNAGIPGYYYFFYNWQYTAITCNTARTAITITDTCTANGINDLFANNNSLQVYPNPSNGQFTTTFHVDNTDNYALKITNTLGQVVYEENLYNFSGTYTKQISVASLRKGVYMLSVSNSKHQAVKRVMIY